MANILIAGCGELGCVLGSLLASKGHNVFGLRRHIDQLPNEITGIKADLTLAIHDLPEKIDYVFYMAAAGKYKDSAYYQAYVAGVRNIISTLQEYKVKRFFFVSSSSVFGQSDGQLVNEESTTTDEYFSTKRLLEGESLVLESSFPATVLRFGGIYGPGRTHLIDLVREGKAHCMEDVWSNRIHSDDCAGILAHLLELNEKSPDKVDSLYVGVDDEPTPSCEVYDWLAEQLCVPDVDHNEPTESARIMRSNKRLSNAKIKATGYEFKYPSYREGYIELI